METHYSPLIGHVGDKEVATYYSQILGGLANMVVWGGEKQAKVVFATQIHGTWEHAKEIHKKIVADVSANPERYKLENLF